MYDAEKTLMGTWGEAWVNDEQWAETTDLNAKATLTKVQVPMCGTMSQKYKVSGWEGKGTITLNKVNSRVARLIADNLRLGKETVCTIISALKDPSADGQERVCLKGVKFDELSLVNWSANKLMTDSIPFTFEDFEYLDMI